ncbi:sodium-independent sulfate anion transporter-like isoform X5 [Bacillus rossius redtenbacheri]|uniref:sodium-independent sulfate anion transporter-like isoform X5 n=1 Tax=Bacillus rossius redtenbacheri TaxID=93214 RepID=UPI002FDE5390
MSSEVGQRDSGKPASWKERAARAADGAMCSRSLLERKLPVAAWLPRYRREDLLHDAVAGVAVGLTAVPQGIAYAVVAGLEPQYGLYAAMTGPFVYVALGSCKDITIGPTAILALLTQSFVSAHGADFAVLLAFLSGCVVFALGLLRMGFLVDFISMPVTVAFTSAAAITIASSQVKDLLGFGGQANNFVQACANLLSRAGRARLWDSALGLTTVAVLLLGKVLGASSAVRTGPERGVWRRAASSALWLLCVARNAVVVLAGALVAYLLHLHGVAPFRLTACRHSLGDGSRCSSPRGCFRRDRGGPAALPATAVQHARQRHGVLVRADGAADGRVLGCGSAHRDPGERSHRQELLQRQVDRRDPGDAGARDEQHPGLLRPLDARDRVVHADRGEQRVWRADAPRGPGHRDADSPRAEVPHRDLLLHPQSEPRRGHRLRHVLHGRLPRRPAALEHQKAGPRSVLRHVHVRPAAQPGVRHPAGRRSRRRVHPVRVGAAQRHHQARNGERQRRAAGEAGARTGVPRGRVRA